MIIDPKDFESESDDALWQYVNSSSVKHAAEEKHLHTRLRANMEIALAVGEALCVLKERWKRLDGSRHKWTEILVERCEVGKREAQRYMQLAHSMHLLDTSYPDWRTTMTLSGALGLLSKPKGNDDSDDDTSTSEESIDGAKEANLSSNEASPALPGPESNPAPIAHAKLADPIEAEATDALIAVNEPKLSMPPLNRALASVEDRSPHTDSMVDVTAISESLAVSIKALGSAASAAREREMIEHIQRITDSLIADAEKIANKCKRKLRAEKPKLTGDEQLVSV